MATWREINEALVVKTGEHAVRAVHVTMDETRVVCGCGVTFAGPNYFDVCTAWFEHRAVRAAFPDAQAVSRG